MGSFEGHAVGRRIGQWAFGTDVVVTQRALVDEDTDGSEGVRAEVILAWQKLCECCGKASLTVAASERVKRIVVPGRRVQERPMRRPVRTGAAPDAVPGPPAGFPGPGVPGVPGGGGGAYSSAPMSVVAPSCGRGLRARGGR